MSITGSLGLSSTTKNAKIICFFSCYSFLYFNILLSASYVIRRAISNLIIPAYTVSSATRVKRKITRFRSCLVWKCNKTTVHLRKFVPFVVIVQILVSPSCFFKCVSKHVTFYFAIMYASSYLISDAYSIILGVSGENCRNCGGKLLNNEPCSSIFKYFLQLLFISFLSWPLFN